MPLPIPLPMPLAFSLFAARLPLLAVLGAAVGLLAWAAIAELRREAGRHRP